MVQSRVCTSQYASTKPAVPHARTHVCHCVREEGQSTWPQYAGLASMSMKFDQPPGRLIRAATLACWLALWSTDQTADAACELQFQGPARQFSAANTDFGSRSDDVSTVDTAIVKNQLLPTGLPAYGPVSGNTSTTSGNRLPVSSSFMLPVKCYGSCRARQLPALV